MMMNAQNVFFYKNSKFNILITIFTQVGTKEMNDKIEKDL